MKFTTVLLSAILASTATAFAPNAPIAARSSTTTRLFGSKDDDDAAAAVGAKSISALTAGVKTVFSSEDIDKILPHRYPFALVDKVIEYEAGKVRFHFLD